MSVTSSPSRALQSQYPWVSFPFVCSAPMRLIATENLATAVTLAKGLGFLAAGTDSALLKSLLGKSTSIFEKSPVESVPPGIIPVGVGFLCWAADVKVAISEIRQAPLKPCAAWLFAPREIENLKRWADGIREASGGLTKIWVQVGSIKDALGAAKVCHPDTLVIQGSDAGGHGLGRSGSLISLLPECTDILKREGFGDIPLIATGGIADGRGAAATLVLGASGICLGTRFLASFEAVISNGYKQALIDTSDGGAATARTSVYDRLRGTTGWPSNYNARGVLNQTYWDHENGMSEENNKKLYDEAAKQGDAGWGVQGRMTTYAGTGVGLVKGVIPAAEIVMEIREDSRRALARANGSL